MIRLATAFSGIGAIEHALNRMGLENEIVFACDNGDVNILTKDVDTDIDEIETELESLSELIKEININDNVEDLYKNQLEGMLRASMTEFHEVDEQLKNVREKDNEMLKNTTTELLDSNVLKVNRKKEYSKRLAKLGKGSFANKRLEEFLLLLAFSNDFRDNNDLLEKVGLTQNVIELLKRFENDKLKKLQIFNGAQLKYIAFISMLIDHVNNALITPFLNGKGFLLHLSNLFSILGRIAFPIFVFFIVEGFFKTSNRKKYLITLLLFGVISEVPFDMFTSKVFFDPYWNNIMFTLALCLITIWIIDAVKDKISNKVLWYSISIVVVGISCAVAMALSLDYDYHAIIVAYIFYIFYDKPILGAGLGYLSIIKELYSCLGFAMTVTYNGERGRQNKWINYLFYPAVPEKYIVPVDNPWEVTAEALAVMQELATEAGDEKLGKMLRPPESDRSVTGSHNEAPGLLRSLAIK